MTKKTLGPVVLDIEGIELQAEEKEILGHPQVGGLILFTRNFEDSKQIAELVKSIRDVREELVICVDHEGGRVQRFRKDFTVLPAMQSLGMEHQEQSELAKNHATELGWLMASELLSHDIDLSFAPILDLDESFSDIIGDRAFSNDPDIATTLAEAFIDGMHEAGMAATGKHFPGHGGVKADSHLELPVDNRTLEVLEQRDIIPYTRLLDKLDAVMSAHIQFPEIDEALVSFSSFWIKHYLKKNMGYQGIVFSDDLTMEGAAGVGDYDARAKLALEAGCDVVLVCNNAAGAIRVIESLEGDPQQYDVRSIAALRAKKRESFEELKNNSRWKLAQEIVEKLK